MKLCLLDVQVGLATAAQTVAGLRGCETGCVEAGQRVVLDVQPRDSLGNVVRTLHVAGTCSSSAPGHTLRMWLYCIDWQAPI